MGGTDLQRIGTSATVGSHGGIREQREEVVRVASQVFGDDVKPEHVVGETLRRVAAPNDLNDTGLPARLAASIRIVATLVANPLAEFMRDPLCSWVESTIGVRVDEGTGTLVRQTPQRLTGPDGVAAEFERLTALSRGSAEAPLQRLPTAGYSIVDDPTSSQPLRAFAFRLHQFYNRGDTVYASPEPPGVRYVTLQAQKLVPGEPEKALLPLAFCREYGHEYYTVWHTQDEDGVQFTPRRLSKVRGTGDASTGYIYVNVERPWPPKDSGEELEAPPENRVEEKNGELRVKSQCTKPSVIINSRYVVMTGHFR